MLKDRQNKMDFIFYWRLCAQVIKITPLWVDQFQRTVSGNADSLTNGAIIIIFHRNRVPIPFLMFQVAKHTIFSVSWGDPVIAIRKNAIQRRIWEDAFAIELEKYAAKATPSYTLFPDAPPDTGRVIAAVQANGFDGILVILRLPSEKDLQYIHGNISSEQDRRYNFYWQRYWSYYREIEHSGYLDSQTVAISAIDVATTGNKTE